MSATKEAEIAAMLTRESSSEIAAEIATCEIRRASCHRRRAAAQFGSIGLTLRLERTERSQVSGLQ